MSQETNQPPEEPDQSVAPGPTDSPPQADPPPVDFTPPQADPPPVDFTPPQADPPPVDFTPPQADPPPPAIPALGPPPGGQAPGARRLLRDPTARLGGVASGLAHFYGVDVSLVRIGFIVLTLFTGVGFVAYLLAWIIVPRSDYWPPLHGHPARSTASNMSNRDVFLALVVLLGLAAVFIQGGWGASWVIPLMLVVAGVWLLNQQASPPVSSASPRPQQPFGSPDPVDPVDTVAPTSTQPWEAVGATVATGGPGASAGPASSMTESTAGPVDGSSTQPMSNPLAGPATASFAPPGASAPSPGFSAAPVPVLVPPRRRRGLIALLIGLFLLFVVLPIVAVIAIVVGVASGGINVGAESRTVTPGAVDEIPEWLEVGVGEIVVDLRGLDPADFDADDPTELDINVGVGSATVYVPEELLVDVTASAGAGDISLFGDTSDGVGQSADIDTPNEQLELYLNVGLGEIKVIQG